MAITYATLAREIDGRAEYIYPKTDATLVDYSISQSIKDKINEIDNCFVEISKNVEEINSILEDSINNDEVIDIRTQNYNVVSADIVYESAGDAIRGQFEAVLAMISTIQTSLKTLQNNTVGTNTIKIENNSLNIQNNATNIQDNASQIQSINESISDILVDIKNLQENTGATINIDYSKIAFDTEEIVN